MKIHFSRLYILSFFFLYPLHFSAQNRNVHYLSYIEKYNELAVKHMLQYKIPASITLAQGILESGAGRSSFVRETNNHFGIKCHSDWRGDRIYRADDGPNDCFRSYSKAEDSFEDHSLFLQRTRYAMLFDLDILDYVAWAKGLQTCSYATDKAYANKLVKLIQDYKLYHYDTKVQTKRMPATILRRTPYFDHGLLYVLAEANDSYARVAGDMGFKAKDLAKYNETPQDFPLRKGDIIYLQKKNKKSNVPYFEHTIRIGESMHSISQRYGMQVKKLYKINKKRTDYVPVEGEILQLR